MQTHINIIENKKTDSCSNGKKKEAWKKVGDEFNSNTSVEHREVWQLKKKFQHFRVIIQLIWTCSLSELDGQTPRPSSCFCLARTNSDKCRRLCRGITKIECCQPIYIPEFWLFWVQHCNTRNFMLSSLFLPLLTHLTLASFSFFV